MQGLDMLGIEFNLFYKKSNKFTTTFGLILSLLLYLIVLLCFIFFGIDIILREKPDVIVNQNFINNPIADLANFTFLLRPMKNNKDTIEEIDRKLNLVLKFIDLDYSREIMPTKYTYIPMVNCSTTRAVRLNENDVISHMIGKPDEYYCIPDSFKEEYMGKHGTNYHKMTVFILK